MAKLKLPNGSIYHYRIIPLFPGIKQINREIAGENLNILKSFLNTNNIKFQLAAGTLLGAVREGDFIAHDEDIDLAFKESDRNRFLNLLPLLKEYGFELCRYDRRDLLSLIRKGEYIDLYFFHKFNESLSICSGWVIKTDHLGNSIEYNFRGENYLIPEHFEDYLVGLYGEDWRTPVKFNNYNQTKFKILIFNIRERLKMLIPKPIFNILAKRAEDKLIGKTLGRLRREGII